MTRNDLPDQINQIQSEIDRIKAGNIPDSEFNAAINKIYGPYTIEGETFWPAEMLIINFYSYKTIKRRFYAIKLENLEYRLADLKSQLAKQEVE